MLRNKLVDRSLITYIYMYLVGGYTYMIDVWKLLDTARE